MVRRQECRERDREKNYDLKSRIIKSTPKPVCRVNIQLPEKLTHKLRDMRKSRSELGEISGNKDTLNTKTTGTKAPEWKRAE